MLSFNVELQISIYVFYVYHLAGLLLRHPQIKVIRVTMGESICAGIVFFLINGRNSTFHYSWPGIVAGELILLGGVVLWSVDCG